MDLTVYADLVATLHLLSVMASEQLCLSVATDIRKKLEEQNLAPKRWLLPLSCCTYIERQRNSVVCKNGSTLRLDPHRSFQLDYENLLDQFVDQDPSYSSLKYILEELK
eukprot:m.219772 g.219772  ORF g.219772 m.219772 type:complete len:109 (-) comp17236_c0_seq1:2331-2657(-)